MDPHIERATHRFARFHEQVIAPAVYPRAMLLEAAIHQFAEPLPFAEASSLAYRPIALNERWGPGWSNAWFRVTGVVPAEWAGQTVALRFSSGSEALLWDARLGPRRGFDENHDSIVLYEPATGGEPVDLLIEAACNHRFGTTGGNFLVDPTRRARWSSPEPGVMERCELAVFDRPVWRLAWTYEFARRLLGELSSETPRARQLIAALSNATAAIDAARVAETAPAAMELLDGALRGGASPSATEAIAIGHAHIDTAWLWRLRETKRKCLRTFSTVLYVMEQFPEFTFLCSQAQQYAWVEKDSPELFARITEQVRAGKWEAAGAMWVEPDGNLPSGESFVRQILYAVRYWEAKFGAHSRQRFLYLPDTFGYSAALPQILKLAGLDTFLTIKLGWNDTNEFPYTNFLWRGIDGSSVRAHIMAAQDYNSTISPHEQRRGERNMANRDEGRTHVWLHPFGFGDGGGGPTEWEALFAKLAEDCEGLPRTRFGSTGTFCDVFAARHEALLQRGENLPIWDGELYLEYHRGTLTTCGYVKRANRRAEEALAAAELLAFGGPAPLAADETRRMREQLEAVWKLTLVNQFHDILPGTSISEVYDDARDDYARINATLSEITAEHLNRWAAACDTTGMQQPLIVFNPATTPGAGVVGTDRGEVYVRDVPPLGVRVLDAAAPPDSPAPVTVDGFTLSNGMLSATIDDLGRISSLVHQPTRHEACGVTGTGQRAVLNQLVLYDDQPRSWDAWDIDREYLHSAAPVETPLTRCEVVEASALRAVIEVERSLGERSRVRQRYVSTAGSPRIDVQTWVDWHEERRLLRALFPVDVRARRATYEMQCGFVERPTHANTSFDRAMFETCAHRWMDLSEPGFGVALLNDCKYGHSCHGSTMGLTLLRSPKSPAPDMDMGEHEFTYALLPHAGDWRVGQVDVQAGMLNTPLQAQALSADQTGAICGAWAPFSVTMEGAGAARVMAVKAAEDDGRLIVRLVEMHGGRGRLRVQWNLPVGDVATVDLLERPLSEPAIRHDAATGVTTCELRPFQIVTLAATRDTTKSV